MAEIQKMPKSGYTMTEGRICSVKVKAGDKVNKGDVLMEYETEKITGEVIASISGTVLDVYVQEGDVVEVFGELCVIGEEGESVVRNDLGTKGSAPAANDTDSGIKDKEETKMSQPKGTVLASPLAKKLAREHGLDISEIKGSGVNGRVEKKDVLAAIEKKNDSSQSTSQSTSQSESLRYEEMSMMRKTVARRLTESKQNAPHAYFRKEVNVSRLLEMRSAYSELAVKKNGKKLSINDIILKATAMALREFPIMNSHIEQDKICYNDDVNLGIAVDIENGLVVPVIHGADKMGLFELSKAAAVLIDKARNNKLTMDEMTGGTFTVSNLGGLGLDEFTAILNPPEAGILTVGTIKDKPVVCNNRITVGKVLVLNLSVDHRLIDGAVAARFLNRICELLEDVYSLLQ